MSGGSRHRHNVYARSGTPGAPLGVEKVLLSPVWLAERSAKLMIRLDQSDGDSISLRLPIRFTVHSAFPFL